MSPDREIAPPAGEELHLPGPSVIPVLNAAGIAIAVVGLTAGWTLIAGGLAIFLFTLILWVRDTRRDIDALPGEHRGH